MPGSFFDTNVLMYFALADPIRFRRCDELVQQGGFISVQVLNEFASVGRRKMGLGWTDLQDKLHALRTLLAVRPLTIETHDLGLHLARRYDLALYDAMLLSAALLADCDIFWSEDMHDGLVIESRLTIRNPFAEA